MALAVADQQGLKPPLSKSSVDCRLSTPFKTRPVNRQVDGLAGRLQGESILAGVANELRVDLVNAHSHQLILGGRLEADLAHRADVFGRDFVNAELHQLVDAHTGNAERL